MGRKSNKGAGATSTSGGLSKGTLGETVHGVASLVIIIIAIFVLVSALLLAFGVFSQTPRVTAKPDNCYEETLHVVAAGDNAPFSFIDDEGKQSGYDVELVTELANRMHMNLDLRFCDWSESIRMVRDGEAQAVTACESHSFVAETVFDLATTLPTANDEFVAFANASTADATAGLSNLYGKRIAVVENGSAYDVLENMGLLQYCVFYPSNRSSLQAVANDECDYAVMRYETGRELVDSMGLGNVQGVASIGNSNICLGVMYGNQDLVRTINEALFDMMGDGVVSSLSTKWLKGFDPPGTLLEELQNNKGMLMIAALASLIVIFVAILGGHSERSKRKLKTANIELQHAKTRAERSNRYRLDFFSYMAHEFKTSINSVIGNVECIYRNREDDGKVEGYLANIEASSYRLLSVLNDTVDAEQLAKGTLVLSRNVFDIALLMDKLCQVRGGIFASHKVTLNIRMGEIEHKDVIGDDVRIRQSVIAIMEMLLAYIPMGSSIDILFEEVECGEGRATFRFVAACDDAHVEPDAFAHIWEMRPQKEEMRASDRNNISAAVSKSVIEYMGGTVIAKTSHDGSISCSIEIPLDIDYSKTIDAEDQNAVKLTDMRVLVADDNALNLEITRDILTDEGVTVQIASSGKEMLKAFEQSPIGFFDVILMDVVMPEMDGLETTRVIRRMGRKDATSIPIIAMSASTQEEDVGLAYEAGMNAFLAKPVDVAQLIRTIASYAIQE